MDADRDTLPDDVAALKAALTTERAWSLEIAAELAVAHAKASEDSAPIAQQSKRSVATLYRVGVDAAKNPPAVTEFWDGVGRQKGRPFGRLIDWNSQPA